MMLWVSLSPLIWILYNLFTAGYYFLSASCVCVCPQVLLWAQEQNEERSPNLTTFTEHFNNMSYWARSRILEQEDSRDRERYVMKFIKIMKHLRKMNNFNSYLALLSALDSAPIRRLEWQRTITDGLKEYCALIDSSSSFRAYRQALSDSTPPCIPYMYVMND